MLYFCVLTGHLKQFFFICSLFHWVFNPVSIIALFLKVPRGLTCTKLVPAHISIIVPQSIILAAPVHMHLLNAKALSRAALVSPLLLPFHSSLYLPDNVSAPSYLRSLYGAAISEVF